MKLNWWLLNCKVLTYFIIWYLIMIVTLIRNHINVRSWTDVKVSNRFVNNCYSTWEAGILFFVTNLQSLLFPLWRYTGSIEFGAYLCLPFSLCGYIYFVLEWCVFYPRPVLAFGYCRCLRLSVCVCVRPGVNHELVRAITHHPFKLGSPNLNHQCKRPWLRSLLFWWWLTLTFKVTFYFKVKIYPILSLSAR